jgi:hypothetical protein
VLRVQGKSKKVKEELAFCVESTRKIKERSWRFVWRVQGNVSKTVLM